MNIVKKTLNYQQTESGKYLYTMIKQDLQQEYEVGLAFNVRDYIE